MGWWMVLAMAGGPKGVTPEALERFCGPYAAMAPLCVGAVANAAARASGRVADCALVGPPTEVAWCEIAVIQQQKKWKPSDLTAPCTVLAGESGAAECITQQTGVAGKEALCAAVPDPVTCGQIARLDRAAAEGTCDMPDLPFDERDACFRKSITNAAQTRTDLAKCDVLPERQRPWCLTTIHEKLAWLHGDAADCEAIAALGRDAASCRAMLPMRDAIRSGSPAACQSVAQPEACLGAQIRQRDHLWTGFQAWQAAAD